MKKYSLCVRWKNENKTVIISKIEKLIEHSADYFEIERGAFVPLKEGKSFDVKSLRALYDSPRYKVLEDLVERYRQKCFE